MSMDEYRDERIPGKRFEVATDPVAKSRLDAFRDGVKHFQKKHPEILGATVFGSMIKGEKATATSDVDAFLYIDREILPEEEKLEPPQAVENRYKSNFLKELRIPESEVSKYYGDLIPKLLSGQVLDDNINSNIAYENASSAFNKMLYETNTSEMTDEERSALYSKRPKRDTPNDDFTISGMFHARVGSGIEKYRYLFLEKLVALPDQELAEKIWISVYAQISTMEGSYDKRRKLPTTLQEGLQTYHPELYRRIVKQKEEAKIQELKNKIQENVATGQNEESVVVPNPIIIEVIEGQEYIIEYVPREEIYPEFGYSSGKYAVIRADLPPRVQRFVKAHELYHCTDRATWGGWIGSEIRANLIPGLKDPIGLTATIWATISDIDRIKLYLRRIKEGH